jgi:hypothetical protein
MTMNRALVLIFLGMMALMAGMSLPLASTDADGAAYSLAMVLVILLGGLANYLAFKRYGSVSHHHRR